MKIIKKLSKKQLFLLAFVLITLMVCLSYYSIQQIKKHAAQVEEQARLNYERKGHELIQLAKYGTLEQVKKAIQEGADINYLENLRFTPIASATLRGDLPMVKWLVENGADIRRRFDGVYLVVYAVKQPNVEVLSYLLEQGIAVNAKNVFGINPLNMAIYNNRLDYVKLLLTHGYQLKNAYYALLYSVMLPDSEITQYLLAQGADKQLKLREGSTLLIAAASAGSLANVQLLVNEGLAVNQADDYELTPLIMAASIGNAPIVNYLIGQGANVNHSTLYGNTALMAAANQGDLDSVKKLIEVGAQIDTQNREGMTALAFAMDGQHTAIQEYLLKQGASKDISISALAKQLRFVKKMYPPSLEERSKISDARLLAIGFKKFDPSQCQNPQDPFMYFAENRLVIKQQSFIYDEDIPYGEKYQPAPMPKPLDPNAPKGCYENPRQKNNIEISEYEPNFWYGNGGLSDSIIRLSQAERAEHCQYWPFSTLRCTVMYGDYAYRVDRAIYSLPLNQPFIIFCQKPGFQNTKCDVIYKNETSMVRYTVNPDNQDYFYKVPAQSIKQIIEEDKAIQSKLEANRIKNYPWQD